MNTLLIIVVFAVLTAATGIPIMMLANKVELWRWKRKYEKRDEAARIAEQKRIAALPPLEKEYLMHIPEWRAARLCGSEENRKGGWFDTRFVSMVICDRNGTMYFGLMTPDLIRSLAASEFVRGNCYVPIKETGQPVMVNDVYIDVYPDWLNPNKLDAQGWCQVAWIEQNFQKVWEATDVANCDDFFNKYLGHDAQTNGQSVMKRYRRPHQSINKRRVSSSQA